MTTGAIYNCEYHRTATCAPRHSPTRFIQMASCHSDKLLFVICQPRSVPLLQSIQILITAAVTCLATLGCDTRKLGDPEATVIFSADLAVIRDAEFGSSYLIDGSVAIEGDDDIGANATDYPVTKDLGPFPQDQIPHLLSVLRDPKTYEWEYVKGCIVTPGVKLKFQSDGHQVDVLFCFECDILSVYRDGQYVSGGNFDFGRPQLVDLLTANFPNDPLIQSLSTSQQ